MGLASGVSSDGEGKDSDCDNRLLELSGLFSGVACNLGNVNNLEFKLCGM